MAAPSPSAGPPPLFTLSRSSPTLTSNPRLSLPAPIRLLLATSLSTLLGLGLGISHGSAVSGLRFRAENAHRLPTSPTGWYLYHKSKNYHMAFGGLKEGVKMGFTLGVWTGLFFGVEEAWDEIRGRRDALNSMIAGLSVAGGFSLWNRLPVVTAAKTAKQALIVSFGLGLAQDAVASMRGNRPAYVDFVLRGGKRKDQDGEKVLVEP